MRAWGPVKGAAPWRVLKARPAHLQKAKEDDGDRAGGTIGADVYLTEKGKKRLGI